MVVDGQRLVLGVDSFVGWISRGLARVEDDCLPKKGTKRMTLVTSDRTFAEFDLTCSLMSPCPAATMHQAQAQEPSAVRARTGFSVRC